MRIIYPPRPRGKIPPSLLVKYEKQGRYLAQRKFNGRRNLIHISPTGDISFYGRYGRSHSDYRISKSLYDEISNLNFIKGKEYWLDSELFHPRVEHTVVLYDVLQAGTYLLGVTIEDRLEILHKICGNPTSFINPPFAFQISTRVWMAETFYNNFSFHFQEYNHLNLIEGLVLKERGSRLDNIGCKQYEVDWQIRCRKPGVSYGY